MAALLTGRSTATLATTSARCPVTSARAVSARLAGSASSAAARLAGPFAAAGPWPAARAATTVCQAHSVHGGHVIIPHYPPPSATTHRTSDILSVSPIAASAHLSKQPLAGGAFGGAARPAAAGPELAAAVPPAAAAAAALEAAAAQAAAAASSAASGPAHGVFVSLDIDDFLMPKGCTSARVQALLTKCRGMEAGAAAAKAYKAAAALQSTSDRLALLDDAARAAYKREGGAVAARQYAAAAAACKELALLEERFMVLEAAVAAAGPDWDAAAAALAALQTPAALAAGPAGAGGGAGSGGSKDSTGVTVYFRSQMKAAYGQQLMVIGSCKELGNWKPEAALPLTWSKGGWVGETVLPEGTRFQFKLLTRPSPDGSGGAAHGQDGAPLSGTGGNAPAAGAAPGPVAWQAGPNREAEVPWGALSFDVTACWAREPAAEIVWMCMPLGEAGQ